MHKRQWFRNQLKKEMVANKRTAMKMLRKRGLRASLHNQIMLSLGMYSEIR